MNKLRIRKQAMFMLGAFLTVLWLAGEVRSQSFLMGGVSGHGTVVRHQLFPGETLVQLTQMYDVNLEHLMKANGIQDSFQVQAGDWIQIPATHAVDRYVPYVPASKRWKYIVIHHSATERGNFEIFDKEHRKRGFQHGLGYHFLINNGTYGTRMGEIHIGERWYRQQIGAHCKAMNMNEQGIGICLVGNFNEKGVPPEQLASALWLIKRLQKHYGIPDERVIRHRDAKIGGTDCPGNHFPWRNFQHTLA